MEIMKKMITILALGLSLFANDIIVKESCLSVDDTVAKLKEVLRAKQLGIFAVINHSGNAKAIDMKLNEAKMIVFGNPRLGTALMQQDMTVGLDLPLRVLVYKDSDGKVKMAYRDGSWLNNKHIINAPKKIQKVNNAMEMFTDKAGQCKQD
jgi:uncharacterized protein (DUF302 family)